MDEDVSRLRKPRSVKSRTRGQDPRYLARVRDLPCCAPGGCLEALPAQAHHLTGAGLALKAQDDETMPLCPGHHSDLHAFAGPFRGWDRARRRKWQLEMIAKTRVALGRRP
mgnify:CR=1 FL=1